ncbi:MAG TPA: HPF/RaiA family ribosome-associated protein, partial [Chlamydiales bacterium]|nr:HPF/RaiA family ribosome-associated protein [Chlamydiales bacterium]
ERYTDKILDIVVTLDVQRLEHSCVFLLNFQHFQIKSHASTDNLYSAIDKASDRMLRLIMKYKTKMMEHAASGVGAVDLNVNVLQPQRDELNEINTDIEAETWLKEQERFQLHKIVATEKVNLRTLTHDYAIMMLECSSAPVFIYRSEEDQKIKVLYRREDGNFAEIEVG